MQIQKEWLDFLREQYPKGSRIRLTEMKDDPYALSPGSMGTLDHIDDAGQFHVKWDNGSGLALIIGEDRFQVQLPEPQTLKFYMPLTAQLYGRDSWGDLEEYGNDLNGRDLRDYEEAVIFCDALRRLVGWQEIRYTLEKYIEKQVQERFFLVGERDDGFTVFPPCTVWPELRPEDVDEGLLRFACYVAVCHTVYGQSFESLTTEHILGLVSQLRQDMVKQLKTAGSGKLPKDIQQRKMLEVYRFLAENTQRIAQLKRTPVYSDDDCTSWWITDGLRIWDATPKEKEKIPAVVLTASLIRNPDERLQALADELNERYGGSWLMPVFMKAIITQPKEQVYETYSPLLDTPQKGYLFHALGMLHYCQCSISGCDWKK